MLSCHAQLAQSAPVSTRTLAQSALRARSPGWAFSLVALAVVGFSVRPAFAAPPAASADDDATVLARAGDRARLAGHFAEAEASYRASIALAPSDSTSLRLALCMAAQGRMRDAAPILARLAKTPGTLAEDDRAKAAEALVDARRELGTFTVKVSVRGAAIEVDGAAGGSAPLAEPLFLDPGKHTFRASLQGYGATEARASAEAGRAYVVELELVPEPVRLPARPSAFSRPTDEPFRGLFMGTEGGVRAAGIALALGLGIGGAAALEVARTNDEASKSLLKTVLGFGPSVCTKPSEQASPYCTRLAQSLDERNSAAKAGVALLVGSGITAALTLLSTVLLPPPKVGTGKTGKNLFLSPTAGPTGGGLFLEASW